MIPDSTLPKEETEPPASLSNPRNLMSKSPWARGISGDLLDLTMT